MKTVIHAQTAPFEFIGFEYEKGEELTQSDIDTSINDFQKLQGAIKGGEGMTEVEMDIWVENMLLAKGNEADVYTKATKPQRIELHRIKRALTRIKAKQNK